MSEPENTLDLQPEATPVEEAATPVDNAQPVETTEAIVEEVVEQKPDAKVLEERLQESEAKMKRYKEQLSGKDKLIESLRIKKLAESLQPQAKEPEDDDYDDEPARVERPKAENFQTELLIENTIATNEWKMSTKHGNDKYVPWNDETKEEVYKELFKLDPTGKAMLRVDAIEIAYNQVRGRKLEAAVGEETQKAIAKKDLEIQALRAKESRKAIEAVETTTIPAQESVVPSIEDIVSGKIVLTSKEMVEFYPELFGPSTKKLLGI